MSDTTTRLEVTDHTGVVHTYDGVGFYETRRYAESPPSRIHERTLTITRWPRSPLHVAQWSGYAKLFVDDTLYAVGVLNGNEFEFRDRWIG